MAEDRLLLNKENFLEALARKIIRDNIFKSAREKGGSISLSCVCESFVSVKENTKFTKERDYTLVDRRLYDIENCPVFQACGYDPSNIKQNSHSDGVTITCPGYGKCACTVRPSSTSHIEFTE